MRPKTLTTSGDVPTLAHIMSTYAYHVGQIMTMRPIGSESTRIRTGFALGHGTGCPQMSMLDFEIRACEGEADAWGPWAQVFIDGVCAGNRHAGVQEYTRRATAVVAWVAAYWAARAANSIDLKATARAAGRA